MGVLVAISIPIFSSRLEKSRDAVTIANLRSAYAEASSAYLLGNDGDVNGVTVDTDAKTAVVSGVDVESKDDDYGTDAGNLPFTLSGQGAKKEGGYTATFTFNDNGTVSCTLS